MRGWITEGFNWLRQELKRVREEESDRKRARRQPEWKEGLDPTGIPLEINLTAAERELAELDFDPKILSYIAGITSHKYERWPITDQIADLADSPLYRLAAVRMLIREGRRNREGGHNRFDIDALQMYAWTGFQKEMLPWNPLFAFVTPGTYPLASLLDQSGLQHWIETASDEDLRAVDKWHSEVLETTDPDLHKWYLEVLAKVGLDRLLYILDVISDPTYLEQTKSGAKENVSRLTTAIAQCAASRLTVGEDKTISAEGFFSTTLVKGPIEYRP